MIIINIIGGLGNQMFQYATGRAVSHRLGVPLKIDTRGLLGYQLHQGFQLDRLFNCQGYVATYDELTSVLGWQSSELAQRVLKRPMLSGLRSKNFMVEPSFNYWSGINQLNGDKYLYGYWQSEKYFSEFADLIRKDFTFKLPLTLENAEVSGKISQSNAVSLHVRRGDYVTNSKNSFIGICSIDYYQAAIRYLSKRISNPIFFVFSDDIDWVRQNLSIQYEKYFIEHNQAEKSHFDMQLMSLCQHNIIANSSFSWWGAWLNENPNKMVIVPKQWFASGKDDSDLIPSSWIRL
jgi:hypothetical protein